LGDVVAIGDFEMKLDEAINMAIDYETKVHKTYLEAMQKASDDAGKRVFKTLCDEERYHLKYLHERLAEWKETGKITVARLDTSIPTQEAIDEGVARLREKMSGDASGKYRNELEMLRKALAVEAETSGFYREMASKLDAEGQQMFARFVEIEEGHQAIVQAEIDCLSGTGVWFDMKEFNLEMG
jgi:rubrerythrin